MYKTTRELKQKALTSLNGKWGTAVLMNLAISLIVMPFSLLMQNESTSGFIAIVVNLISIILSVGYTSFLLKLCCGQKEQAAMKDLFYGFKCYPGKAICLYLLTFLYMIPGTIIYAILLGVFVFATMAGNSSLMYAVIYGDINSLNPAMFTGVIIGFIILSILYFIYAIYIETTYGLVYLLLLDYPDLSTKEIWKRSAQLMKGNRWRMIKLELSFFPLIILVSVATVVLAGIPLAKVAAFTIFFVVIFAVGIHMSTANVEFYLDLMQHQSYKAGKAAPVQTMDYTEVISSGNLTHDCEDTHGNSFENRETDYSGIDKDSFK